MVSNITAAKRNAQDKGNSADVDQDSECSQRLHVAISTMPRANPAFFSVRRAEGREKKIRAVADATDKVENNIA